MEIKQIFTRISI